MKQPDADERPDLESVIGALTQSLAEVEEALNNKPASPAGAAPPKPDGQNKKEIQINGDRVAGKPER